MSLSRAKFRESSHFRSPIRDLGLCIAGTRLEPIVAEFEQELRDKGIIAIGAKCYLSTEWGVSFGGIAIGIPFYLARPDLMELHAEEVGHIEGTSPASILSYLRHEMGHVINYAYRLYDQEEWIKLFGSITQPYLEEYRPEPFSQSFVRHLPGWYAQKHPDEDWSETFAVWMTPHLDWQADYGDWPEALAKLEYCNRTMQRLRNVEPLVTEPELDEAVEQLDFSVEQYYKTYYPVEAHAATGLDGALRAIFEDLEELDEFTLPQQHQKASSLILEMERTLMAEVFRWTGHFPERTRSLLRYLAQRADALEQVYIEPREQEAATALTVLVTSLAMNFVHGGSYFPKRAPKERKEPLVG